MKATYYELQGPHALQLREEDLGGPLRPREVLARTEFSAISTGTELAAWQGKPPLRPSRAYPRLVGYSNVAEVLALGSDTEGLRVGDHILTHQSHRSAFRCPTGDVLLSLREASELDRKALATAYLYHLGYAALLRADYTPGHAVAVVGFGALGLATTQLAHAFGGSPIVFTGRPETARAALPRGVQARAKAMPDAGEMRKLSGMDGVDIVINTSDVWDDFLLGQQITRADGIIVCLGFPGRGLPPPAFNPLDSQYFYDKQLTVCHCGHVPMDGAPSEVRFTLKRNLRYLFGLLRDGRLSASQLLGVESRFDDLANVYGQLSGASRHSYSALLKWRD